MSGIRNRRFRLAVPAAALAAVVLLNTGCLDKLKARDNINSGTAAFKAGNFAEAADHFKKAAELDPKLPNVRIYLATAYIQQYIPGTETDENKKYAIEAMRQLEETLKDDPTNVLATAYIASLYYQMKDNVNALVWNKKVIAIDPKNKEAYYTLGVIAWQDFLPADREALIAEHKQTGQGPLSNVKTKAELRAKYWDSLTQGIEYEKKALAIDPEYENAMSYLNLLYRYRADLVDTKEDYAGDTKQADTYMEQALQTMKNKAAKKAANPSPDVK